MSVRTLERTALSRLKRILRTHDQSGPEVPLPLRTELFLIAHDDETGRPHLNERSLTLGLSAAVLLELWLAGRIHIGWRYDVRRGRWVVDPGLITVAKRDPIGDPLSDIVLAEIWNSGTPLRVGEFVRRYAETVDFHERVRAHMVAAGVIRRTVQRRFWFFRTERYVPVETRESVRVRARVRRLVNRNRDDAASDDRHLALAALVMALGLTRYLYPPEMSPAQLQQRLENLIAMRPDPTIREAAAAINPKFVPAIQ
ncbi:MAG TPA: GPP34 family phosphoprotein [Micromonosporaceae bacterium]